jgi:hypothetical protein
MKHSTRWRAVLISAFLTSGGVAHAQPLAAPPSNTQPPERDAQPAKDAAPTKNETSGLALGAGLGYQFAGFGGQLAYYLELGSALRIAPYAGGGVFPSEVGTKGGYAAGMMFSYGRRHRIVLDGGYGLAAVEGKKNVLTGEVIESRVVYGVTGALGYEYLADGGFFVRPTFGYTRFTGDSDHEGTVTLNVALGYKLF